MPSPAGLGRVARDGAVDAMYRGGGRSNGVAPPRGRRPEVRAMSEAPQRSETIVVNGEPRPLPDGGLLSALIASLDLEGKRVAVAINREVIPRSTHATCTIAPGDRVEILEAVGGG
jgi:sulfur carrier protein